MERPRVADAEDGLQICMVAVNIIIKQSWTAEKVWSLSWGFGVRLKTHDHKKRACYEMLHSVSELACSCEHDNENSGSVKDVKFLD
jgi:hypothetical protein